MEKKKLYIVLAMFLILLASVIFGLFWYQSHYVLIEGQSYSRDLETLDLRDRELTAEQYQTYRAALPQTDILWNVPFQGARLPQDTKAVTVASLTQEDMDMLAWLPALEAVDARQCDDHEALLALCRQYPDLDVAWLVSIGGRDWPQDTKDLTLSSPTGEDLARLPYLPSLETVTVETGDTANVPQLQQYCRDRSIGVSLMVGGEALADTTGDITLEAVTEADLQMLSLMTELKTAHFVDPQASGESLLAFREGCPGACVTWEVEICSRMFPDDTKEVDLSGIQIADLNAVRQSMDCLTEAEKLIIDDMSHDNEVLAAWREEVRDRYKVVWTVQLGKKLTSRTDATTFMPVREHVYYFHDDEAYNLRYCEDMETIDIGHMSISDVSFLAFMPKLRHLVLMENPVRDLTPISNCKSLVFLELDFSGVQDFTPLIGCTALEDINIGKTTADVTPLTQMPWLKNIWANFRGRESVAILQEALPDTFIHTYFGAWSPTCKVWCVSGGWRDLQNYYDMRDNLGMEYMPID